MDASLIDLAIMGFVIGLSGRFAVGGKWYKPPKK